MSTLQQWMTSQANPEIVVNENFQVLAAAAVYGRDPTITTGLTWGYLGGRFGGVAVSNGTISLSPSASNYVVVNRSNGVVSTSTNDDNWVDTNNYSRLYLVVTGTSTVTSFEDHRIGAGGIFGGTARDIAVSATAPSSPIVGDLWVDIS